MPIQSASMVNLELLIKLLKMTTAANDGEALNAMRMANAQLAKVGGDWETLLRGKVTIIEDPFNSIGVQTPPKNDWKPKASFANPQPVYTRPPPPRTPPPPPPPPRPYDPYATSTKLKTKATPAPPPYSGPPPIVTFYKRFGEWVLRSNTQVPEGLRVDVVRKDGTSDKHYLGTFIESAAGGFIYNIQGKTSQKPPGSPTSDPGTINSLMDDLTS